MSKRYNHKVTDQEFLQALKASAGIYARAARYIEEKHKVSYTRQAVKDRVDNNFTKEVAQIRETNIDLSEGVILELMESFDDNIRFKSAQFYLKTIGKKRGFTEKIDHEHTGKDGGAIEIKQITGMEIK